MTKNLQLNIRIDNSTRESLELLCSHWNVSEAEAITTLVQDAIAKLDVRRVKVTAFNTGAVATGLYFPDKDSVRVGKNEYEHPTVLGEFDVYIEHW